MGQNVNTGAPGQRNLLEFLVQIATFQSIRKYFYFEVLRKKKEEKENDSIKTCRIGFSTLEENYGNSGGLLFKMLSHQYEKNQASMK